VGIAVDAAGRIYVADAYQPSVVRVDDMTGDNWTSVGLGSGATPHSIAVDPSGMVLVGGDGVQIVDNMAVVLTSSTSLTQNHDPYLVFGATPVRQPTLRPDGSMTGAPKVSNSGHLSSTQVVTLNGAGTIPAASLAPTAGSTSSAKAVPSV